MSLFVDIVAAFSLLTGGFFMLVAAVGLLKLPDVYCRAHALGKAMTLGIIFLMVGTGFLVEEISWTKVLTGMFFQLITIPVASHLFCLVAYRRKLARWSKDGWVGRQ